MFRIARLLGLMAFFFSCGQDKPVPTIEKPAAPAAQAPIAQAKKKIVFFGNSLTAGYGLSPEQAFSAIIQHTIDSLGLAYTCVNAGNSGETTAGGLTRIDWILQQPMDVFVLELGGNDALRGVPVKASAENLQAIVVKVKAKYPDCKIVIAGMLAPPNMGAAYTAAFRKMYVEIAQQHSTQLIPFLLEGVGGDPKLNQADGIHPTAEGHRIVAQNVWKVLQKSL